MILRYNWCMKEIKKELEIFDNINRLEILKCLKNKGEMPVGSIADKTKLSFKTVSRQLLYLAKNGIVDRRYDGQFVLYKISGNLSKTSSLIISNLL